MLDYNYKLRYLPLFFADVNRVSLYIEKGNKTLYFSDRGKKNRAFADLVSKNRTQIYIDFFDSIY